jgi:2-polyprenyl-3-methyl-5-hydroxy-6-metoxy-1,4-benzoquinol methylase
MAEFEYVGTELALFAHAVNWKAYWKKRIAPWLHGDVLEVGAGIGANTLALVDRAARWTCLEPDAHLLAEARSAHAGSGSAARVSYVCGTLEGLDASAAFDAIVYLDVLEHIEDDRAEMRRAAAHLRPGGALIVLAPAHQRLYSEFDRSIGHFRRYDRASLSAVEPAGLTRLQLRYLDSVGLCASLANRVFLHQSRPSLQQIRTWDRTMVPLSRVLDPLLFFGVGKSILGVWRRPIE